MLEAARWRISTNTKILPLFQKSTLPASEAALAAVVLAAVVRSALLEISRLLRIAVAPGVLVVLRRKSLAFTAAAFRGTGLAGDACGAPKGAVLLGVAFSRIRSHGGVEAGSAEALLESSANTRGDFVDRQSRTFFPD